MAEEDTNASGKNEDKIKWVCDECRVQIGWITNNNYRYGLTNDSFAVEEETGKELCPECFHKTPEGKEV